MAHPSDTGEGNIVHLVEKGLEGLEVYSPYHNLKEQEAFRIFAEFHGLVITAGSDFHGKKIKPDVDLGQVYGDHYNLVIKLKRERRGK